MSASTCSWTWVSYTGRWTCRNTPIGVAALGPWAMRDSMNANDGSSRWASWTRMFSSPTSATLTSWGLAWGDMAMPISRSAPKRIGSPSTRRIW